MSSKQNNLSHKYIDKARRVLSDSKDMYNKGSYDSAVNRAYYSILYSAKAVFALDGKECNSHNGAKPSASY